MGQLDCFAATHEGFVRTVNEDQFLLADVCRTLAVLQTSLTIDHHSRINGNSLGKLLAVADGLGPPESAIRASVITIERLIEFALNRFSWQGSQTTDTQGNLQEELIEAFLDCQESIVQEANVLSNTHSREMTSSAALGIVCWPVMHLAWAGNCRCYCCRSQNLTLLTDERLPASGQTDSDYPSPVASSTEGKEQAQSQDVAGGLLQRLDQRITECWWTGQHHSHCGTFFEARSNHRFGDGFHTGGRPVESVKKFE